MRKTGKMVFRSGGNPPVAAGVFGPDGERLAWWPAGYERTQGNIEVVLKLIQDRDYDWVPVSREAIREALNPRV